MRNLVQEAIPYSAFLERLLQSGRVDETKLNQLALSPLPDNFLTNFAPWDQIIEQLNESELKKQLRRLRTITFSQLLIRDLSMQGNLNEVMQTMTKLADFSLLKAQALTEQQYSLRYGYPIGSNHQNIQHLTIIAMGKMGGYELNASSDIDIIFSFPEDGITNGKKSISNQDFFSKVAKKIITIIDDITEDGRVFRVDTRLRPNGDSGPIVMSENGLEHYLLREGREWERYAWTKARVVSPFPNNIHTIATPFIYRKYLDFNSFQAMRKLHQQIRQEISRSDLNDNIKLGYGGIREIEFIAQIFQMIRGGELTDLQVKSTVETLQRLHKLQILDEKKINLLLKAYFFLRNLEHRLQYKEDQQTQNLPQNSIDQNLIAKSMGFKQYDDFLSQLDIHRDNVNTLFNDILYEPDSENHKTNNDLKSLWLGIDQTEIQIKTLEQYKFPEPEKFIYQLQNFKQSSVYEKLRPNVQLLFDSLIPKYLQCIAKLNADSTTLERVIEFSKNITGRSSYLTFLNEYHGVTYQLISILNQSKWMSDYLTNHPILLDELINAQLLNTDLNWEEKKSILTRKLSLVPNDIEQQMDIVRKFQHSFIFRLAVQELKGLWTVEQLSDQLSILADIILDKAITQVWNNYKKAHIQTPKFGIIAYGKLGGKELSYDSDLDLVYLYDDSYTEANEIYSWFSSRLTSFLSTTTSSGSLYTVDLRLRPNGEAGFLSTNFEVFETYQYNSAWIWEHQALTRARFVAGDSQIEHQFNQVRKNILMLKRNREDLKKEIVQMRYKMLSTHPDDFSNIKYARGGLADVEFIVQYIVLAYSHQYPELTKNLGNITLLKMAAEHGIIDSDLAEKARVAYRNYRKISHNNVLHDVPPPVDLIDLEENYLNVKQLWHQVFPEDKKNTY
ncbi:MAG: bifunctional [glutamate--ammonia ligase]-adenylyl-L-tyrosine phosphorylase/[glutamate--ammonia-ligase] adenylyltransferase [Neisseriaceae bacterium]|nr:MAG: bifunctional [glutamate--ammonia ligase]-adenylyl-L-tyrosine phosphorylase/[glutamate--ammonia-ligase] adenylyltransferase [Neisseriaceae bacterium]